MHLADRWPSMTLSPHNADTRIDNGQVVCLAPRRRVLIYGAGLYNAEAPLDDESWEVWALNLIPPRDSAGRLRADRWFDLHQREAQTADDMRWIEACPVPIYVPPDLMAGVPMAVEFPLAALEALYGGYWACTFAYQVALAMYLGFEDIGLYGVELAYGTDRERTVEWACVAYWLGRAEQSGMGIHLPERSTLGNHWGRYGFEYQREIDNVKRYISNVRQAHEGVDVGG